MSSQMVTPMRRPPKSMMPWLRRRLEIAVLVKHVVGRQEAFAGDNGNLAPVAPCGGVEERPALAGGVCLHEPDQRRDIADRGGDFRQRRFNIGDKAALEEQIARRISGDRQLREYHNLGSLGDEGTIGVEDTAGVSGKVADGRVDLCEANAHGVWR